MGTIKMNRFSINFAEKQRFGWSLSVSIKLTDASFLLWYLAPHSSSSAVARIQRQREHARPWHAKHRVAGECSDLLLREPLGAKYTLPNPWQICAMANSGFCHESLQNGSANHGQTIFLPPNAPAIRFTLRARYRV